MAAKKRRKSPTRRRARAHPRGVLSVTMQGFGFVQCAEGEFFIPASKMAGAFDGDFVEVAPVHINHQHKQTYKGHQLGDRPTGRVLRVIHRHHESVIGRYEVAEPFGVVIPEDPRIPYDIFTLLKDNPDIEDGAMVRVRLLEYPSSKSAATGVIEEVLGSQESAHLDAEYVIARHQLETRFSEASHVQAKKATLDEAGAILAGYQDLRERVLFTIDPDDAKDFDDAVSFEEVAALKEVPKEAKGTLWRVGVHIADVSHYVAWGSSIDLDARRRATSVYLADRVLPMLPEELSSDLCSLRPHEVRRSMTVDLYLDDRANLVYAEFYPALIRSAARLTYTQVQEFLEREGCSSATPAQTKSASLDPRFIPQEIAERICALSNIAKMRLVRRRRLGGLEFDTVEARVLLNADGHPYDVELRRKTDATSLIEEAMILANEAVAEFMNQEAFPCLYRTHEAPSIERLSELASLLQELPAYHKLDVGKFVLGDQSVLQGVLQTAQGRLEQELVTGLLLRCMKRAVYQPNCEPHYGLALNSYTHFTSPIRRYPDLVVHRMLKSCLFEKSATFDEEVHALKWVAEHSSHMECIAEAASRELQEMKMCELLQEHIGEVFDGVVSGVTTAGVFVRLPNSAEGLVPLRLLGNEYFAFDSVRHTLTGSDSGQEFRLGQQISVVLCGIEKRRRHIDFRLAKQR